MKALQKIIQRVAEYPAQPWALATLVQTRGSTYRKAGTRLLVDPNGATLGFLTGGCLEEEIGRQGRYVIRDGSPVLLSFDGTALRMRWPAKNSGGTACSGRRERQPHHSYRSVS